MKRIRLLGFLLILAVLPTATSKCSAFEQALQPSTESKGKDVEEITQTRRNEDAIQGRTCLSKVLRTAAVEGEGPKTQTLVQLSERVAYADKPAKDDSVAESEVKLSRQVQKFVKWLPTDTETLIVAHDVPLSKPMRSVDGKDREAGIAHSPKLRTSVKVEGCSAIGEQRQDARRTRFNWGTQIARIRHSG